MNTPASDNTHVDFEDHKIDKALRDAMSEKPSAPPSTHESIPYDDGYENFPDGGRGWIVILGCMIYSGITVGWGLVWGVTEEYLKTHVFPDADDGTLSFLGSVPSMILTILSIVTGKLGDRYGYKPFLAAGAILWTISMLACAFCTELWHFFIVMGPLQGIANALVYPLITTLPAQWFLKYRASASGIVVAGSSLGGAIGSLIFRFLLSAVGLRKAFGIFTAIDGALFVVAYFMIRERRPASRRPHIIWFDRAFFVDPVFWSLGLCLLFTGLGYLGPIFLLPTFTHDKLPRLSDLSNALPITILNFSAAAGRTVVGFAADRIGPVNAMFFVIAVSGLSQLLLWTFVSNYAGIMAFAVLYGFFCGSFLSVAPAVAAQLYGSGRLAGLSGLLLLFSLPGNAASAPIGAALLNGTRRNWRVVSCCYGAVQVLGAMLLLYARFKRQPKAFAAY